MSSLIPNEAVKEVDFPNVVQVVDILGHTITKLKKRKKNKPFNYLKHARKRGRIPMNKKYLLLKKCFISHRFEGAAKLLSFFFEDMTVYELYIYRAAMTLIENIKDHPCIEKLNDFIGTMKDLRNLNKKEVVLNYIIWGIKNNNFDLHLTLEKVMPLKIQPKLKKNEIIDPILEVYLGMFHYIEWCKCAKGNLCGSSGDVFAETAINVFEQTLEHPGQWDIFILKLVEMLKFFDKNDKVKKILKKYVEVNPEHINGYIYLITFLNDYEPNSQELFENIKKLSKLCPSDERILILIEKRLESNSRLKKSIKLLFNFLDYPANSKNLKAWKMLSFLLSEAISNNKQKAQETIASCWKMKYESWNFIHFRPLPMDLTEIIDIELALYKVEVLLTFVNKHQYIDQVLTDLPFGIAVLLSDYPHLKNLLKIFDECNNDHN